MEGTATASFTESFTASFTESLTASLTASATATATALATAVATALATPVPTANGTDAPSGDAVTCENTNPEWLQYIGITMAILGNILISVGLNVQKQSHNKNEAAAVKKNYLLQKMWWVGFAMMLGGEIGNFAAYAFANPAVVAPLGTVALITNAIVAPLALKEKFRKQDLVGILIAMFGAILVVIFAHSDSCQKTADEIGAALVGTKFLVFTAFMAAAVIALWYFAHKYGKKYLLLNIGLVGIFGGYTVVGTSAVSSLMFSDFAKMFTEWVFYVMLVILVASAVLQIRFLQAALQSFDSTEVIPAQFVCFTIGAIVCSAVLYGDFEGMSAGNMTAFIFGCLLTFLGVYVITKGRTPAKPRGSSQIKSHGHNSHYANGSGSGNGSNDSEDSPLIANAPVVPFGEDESLLTKFQHMTQPTFEAILAGIRAPTLLSSKAVDISYNELDEDLSDDVEGGTNSNGEHIPMFDGRKPITSDVLNIASNGSTGSLGSSHQHASYHSMQDSSEPFSADDDETRLV